MLQLTMYGAVIRCFKSLITEFTSTCIMPYITASSVDYLPFDLRNRMSKFHTITPVPVKI